MPISKFFLSAVCLTASLLLTGCANSPKDLAVKLTEYVYAGQTDKIYRHMYYVDENNSELTGAALRKALSQRMAVTQEMAQSRAAMSGGIKSINTGFVAFSGDGDNSSVTVTVIFNDKNAVPAVEQMHFVNINGTWKYDPNPRILSSL